MDGQDLEGLALGPGVDVKSAMAERRACFADGRRVVIPDCGHMLHHDQPEAVADALIAFLGD